MRGSFSRLLLALIAGGALGAGTTALLADGPPRPVAEAPQPTAVEPRPVRVEEPWIEGGVRFRSTVLVPVSFVVGDGTAELEFDLVPLHWTVSPLEELGDDEVPVQPETWELALRNGGRFEAATVLADRLVRFDIPVDVVAADVVAVRVTGWRIAVPVASAVTVPIEVGRRATFPDGDTIEISTVLQQTSSTIVQLDSLAADESWTGHSFAVIRTPDPGWRITFRFGQSSNAQLIWEGDDAPDELVLVQAEPAWTPVGADTVVIGGDDE